MIKHLYKEIRTHIAIKQRRKALQTANVKTVDPKNQAVVLSTKPPGHGYGVSSQSSWKQWLKHLFVTKPLVKQATKSETGKKIIEIKNFFLGFEQPLDGKIKQILTDVNLDVYQGEKLAIIGESGSGKTVLSNAIACLLGSDAKKQGKISVDGIDITNLKGRKLNQSKILGEKVSYVFQNPLQTLNPYYRIGKQLMETLSFRWYHFNSKAQAKKQVLKVLAELNLPNPELVFNSYPHQLSGGMIQRVVIACSLLLKPKVLILDEPTSALDAVVELQILGILNQIAAAGTTIILISHDLNLVSSFADRIAVMYAGKIVEIGKNEEINLFPQHPYTWGLLMSIPSYGHPLYSIPGRVPADLSKVVGDSFAARNPDYAMTIDFEKAPPLFQLSPTHAAATWLLSKHAPKYQPPEEIVKRWSAFKTTKVLPEEKIVYQPMTYDQEAEAGEKVLEIKGLNITYDNGMFINKVVHGVDLDIRKGEIVGLIGESGSGKSTIAKSVAGLVDFSAEKAQILGVESPRLSQEIIGRTRTRYARSLQMIYQNPAVSLNNFKKLWKVVGEALFHHPEFLNQQVNQLYQKEFFHEQEINTTEIQQKIVKINDLNRQINLLKAAIKSEKRSLKLNFFQQKRQLINKFLLDLSISKSALIFNFLPRSFLLLRYLKLKRFQQLSQYYEKMINNFRNNKYEAYQLLINKNQKSFAAIIDLQQQLLQEKQALNVIFNDPVAFKKHFRKKHNYLLVSKEIRKLENKISKLSTQAIKKHVLAALKQVGLGEMHMEMYPWQLSGGQQQRAAIARSLLMSPKLLIADEPIASLDVSLQSGIISLIGKLIKEKNMATLFISHDLEMLSQIADRVYVLYKGIVVEKGRAIEIFANPVHPYTKMLVSSSKNKGFNRDLSQVFVFDPQKDYFADQNKKKFWQVGNNNHFVYANYHEFQTWSQIAGV